MVLIGYLEWGLGWGMIEHPDGDYTDVPGHNLGCLDHGSTLVGRGRVGTLPDGDTHRGMSDVSGNFHLLKTPLEMGFPQVDFDDFRPIPAKNLKNAKSEGRWSLLGRTEP